MRVGIQEPPVATTCDGKRRRHTRTEAPICRLAHEDDLLPSQGPKAARDGHPPGDTRPVFLHHATIDTQSTANLPPDGLSRKLTPITQIEYYALNEPGRSTLAE